MNRANGSVTNTEIGMRKTIGALRKNVKNYWAFPLAYAKRAFSNHTTFPKKLELFSMRTEIGYAADPYPK